MSSPLFEHLPEISDEVRAAPHLLLGLDFDGTLAPIVAYPADGKIPEDTRALLEKLASRPDITLAVVSGRALHDLAARTGVEVIFAGNHGLEIRGDGFEFRHPQAADWERIVHQMCDEIGRRIADIPGSLAEDKGLTASVHVRNVTDSARVKMASIVAAVVEGHSSQFTWREGKMIFEILPRVTWNKGAAMSWLRRQLEADQFRQQETSDLLTLYIGDDVTDEDVFSAIDGITVRVAADGPTAARFTVDHPGEVTAFLQWLSSPGVAGSRGASPHSA